MKEKHLLDNLQNLDEFKCLFPDRLELAKTAKLFPQHADALINVVLQNHDEFKRLFQDSRALYKTIEGPFPQHADALINVVLQNHDVFKQLCPNSWELANTAKLFPQHADALINVVLKNPDVFKQLYPDRKELLSTAKLFPQHANALINVVLQNPNEFQRLFPNPPILFRLPTHTNRTKMSPAFPDVAKIFPKYAVIFCKPNAAEASKAAHAYSKEMSSGEIRKNISILVQATRTGTSFFKSIPSEVQAKIAGFTGNSKVHNEKESYDIASSYFENKGM